MKKRIVLSLLMVVIAVAVFLHFPAKTVNQPNYQTQPQDQTYLVTKVIDSDTIVIDNGEHVCLIGVDTPESRDNPKLRRDTKRTGQDFATIIAMGKEAAEFTRKLVEGKQVRLEYDVQQRDKYGRLLAYVNYLQYEDVTIPSPPAPAGVNAIGDIWNMLNAELIRSGYAQVMTIPPNVKYADLFLKLQKEAREQKRGLWGK